MDCRLAVRRSNRGGDPAAKPDTYTECKSRMDKIKLPRCLLGATYDLNTDKGEVGGSSPPRPTIKSSINTRLFSLFPFQGPAPQ